MGGVIVGLENLKQSTELQIIAYPLARNGRPDTDEPPVGRFIAVSAGYLESGDYARGRQVTVTGEIDRLREEKWVRRIISFRFCSHRRYNSGH